MEIKDIKLHGLSHKINLGRNTEFKRLDQVYIFKRPINKQDYKDIFRSIIEAEDRLGSLDKIDFADYLIQCGREYKKIIRKHLKIKK